MHELVPILGDGERSSVLAYIASERQLRPEFSVVDVGGSVVGWSAGVANAIVDINPPRRGETGGIRYFKANISRHDDWKALDDYTARHGKFDFSICSHTLEDISNPALVCRKLAAISHAGYIAVPSKFVEMARFEKRLDSGMYYRGHIHHRWIFTIRNGELWGFPKIPFLEVDPFFDQIGRQVTHANRDMSFYWHEDLKLNIVNDDYLGPNVDAVISYYREQLIGDDVDATSGAVYA